MIDSGPISRGKLKPTQGGGDYQKWCKMNEVSRKISTFKQHFYQEEAPEVQNKLHKRVDRFPLLGVERYYSRNSARSGHAKSNSGAVQISSWPIGPAKLFLAPVQTRSTIHKGLRPLASALDVKRKSMRYGCVT